MSEIEFGLVGEFPYSIHKHPRLGHLCGYIAVPPAHPWFGKSYDDIDVDVHGGLTFEHASVFAHPAEMARLEEKANAADAMFGDHYRRLATAEKEKAGEEDDYPHALGTEAWWYGFDCAHSGDLSPGMGHSFGHEVYRDRDYVFVEIERLASQAAAAWMRALPSADVLA